MSKKLGGYLGGAPFPARELFPQGKAPSFTVNFWGEVCGSESAVGGVGMTVGR